MEDGKKCEDEMKCASPDQPIVRNHG